jgi:membrane peptidoglycan carboxypeptidase
MMITGGGLPARMWHDIMMAASRDYPVQDLKVPSHGIIETLFGNNNSNAQPTTETPPQAQDASIEVAPEETSESRAPESRAEAPVSSAFSGVLKRLGE